MDAWRHWQVEQDENDCVALYLKVEGRSANVLHFGVLNELESVMDWLEQENPAGVIVGTEPGRAFALGADVAEFERLERREDILQMVHNGQDLFERWSEQEFPTVAAIRGYCLGGGLEFALACDYRVAEDDPGLKLGLPEVKLGIHPGYGGTVRLPQVIGDYAAVRMMMTGRMVTGKGATASGLVDAVVPQRQLYPQARRLLKSRRLSPSRARWYQRCPHGSILRRIIAIPYYRSLRAGIQEKHYPAPYQLLRHWQRMPFSPYRALEAEAESLAGLVESSSGRQLVRLFLLREQLKRQHSDGEKVAHVHVIGAGAMGGDMSAWCAMQGLRVTLQATDPARIAPAVPRAKRLFARKPHLARESWDRLIPDVAGNGVGAADLVIEAITEKFQAKRELYQWLEPRLQRGAVLATNTSSLPLEELAEGLQEPQRLVGVHFFNPVARMPLVELIWHGEDQTAALARAGRFVRQIDRVGVVVRSSPGFLVNRILMPYLLEAARLVEEGVSAATVDHVAKNFGMPMGPLELADMVGLDICLSAGGVIAAAHGLEVPSILRQHTGEGRLGRKSGSGFYRWKEGRAVIGNPRKAPKDCEDRLILGMVRAAVHCLHEGVVADFDTVDAGVILGTGFAAWTGGPLQIVKTTGVDQICARLENLEQAYGGRFAPGPGWDSPQLRGSEG